MYGAFIRQVRQVRQVRQPQGLNQQVLAGIAGISLPNLSAYERDRRTPTADTLNRILVACGYELAATDGTRAIHCPPPRVRP